MKSHKKSVTCEKLDNPYNSHQLLIIPNGLSNNKKTTERTVYRLLKQYKASLQLKKKKIKCEQ